MVRRNCDRSFNAMSMDEFDDSELICGSESSDQADLTFFCGTFSRLVHMTEEQSEKCGSMEAMLVEIQNTLSQLSNQLGIHPIAAETSRQTLPVPYSDPYIRDAHSRFPLDNSTSLLPEFDGSNASDWLSKVERFFRVGRYSDLDKLDLVAFSLEGDVLKWFNWEMTRNAFHTWDEFRRRLFLRFAATPEASSETVTDNLEARASYQVPVVSVEPSLSFSSESVDVTVAWPSEMVRINRVHSQAGVECVKNKNNAHHVLDALLLRRHKFQPRKKPSLSPKSRMFKFKTMTLPRTWSQMDLLQVIDISKVNNPYPCFSATVGLVRKKRRFQCLRLKQQAHKSRVIYQLRMLHDPGGKQDEHFDEISETEVDIGKVQRTQLDIVAETVITTPDNVASSTNVIPNRQNWNAACDAAIDALDGTTTWIVVSLPANNIEEAVEITQVTLLLPLILDDLKSHMRHKWKSKHLRAVFDFQSNLSSALVVVNEPVTECQNTDAIFQLVLKRTASHEWHRWKHKTAYVEGLLDIVVFALVKLQDIDKEMGADPVTQAHKFTVDKFGRLHTTRLTVLRVLCLLSTLFWRTSFKKQKFGKNWWYKFKHGFWQREGGKELLEVEVVVAETMVDVRCDDVGRWELLINGKIMMLLSLCGCFPRLLLKVLAAPLLKVLKSWMFKYKPQLEPTVCTCGEFSRREFLIQWQGRDVLENSWVYSMAFVQSYHAFKLEDKLVFGEGSIDTIKQSYCRRKREESVSSKAREASGGNRGFAEKN